MHHLDVVACDQWRPARASHERTHVVPGPPGLLDHPHPDEPGRPGDEQLHVGLRRSDGALTRSGDMRGKVIMLPINITENISVIKRAFLSSSDTDRKTL